MNDALGWAAVSLAIGIHLAVSYGWLTRRPMYFVLSVLANGGIVIYALNVQLYSQAIVSTVFFGVAVVELIRLVRYRASAG